MKRYRLDPRKPSRLTPAELGGWTPSQLTIRIFRLLDDSFFKKATVPWPPVKKQLTIRLDADVLTWLKRQGRGYQTRINHILRVAMESQPARSFRSR